MKQHCRLRLTRTKSILARTNKGIALLTVLPIIAIIAALIYYVADAEKFMIQRINFQAQKQEMLSLAEGGESLAVDILLNDFVDDKKASDIINGVRANVVNAGDYNPDNDSLLEAWSKPISPTLFSNDSDNLFAPSHEIAIIDLNRFFNVNNLHTDANANSFALDILFNIIAIERLLETNAEIEALTYNILDWLDFDDIRYGTENESESEYYKNLGSINVPPNRQINHVSELQYVDGMTPKILEKLSQHVQAFPIYERGSTDALLHRNSLNNQSNVAKININTTHETILAALVGKFFKGDPAVINYIKRRQGLFADTANSRFNLSSIDSIIAANPLSLNEDNDAFIKAWISTRSSHFLVQNFIESEKFSFNLLSYVFRSADININKQNFSEDIWVYQRQLAWNKMNFGSHNEVDKNNQESQP